MIEQLSAVVLSNAIVVTVLTVVVLAATRIWRHAPLAHLLWLVVLMKLVTPPVVNLPVAIPGVSESVADRDTEPFGSVVPTPKVHNSAIRKGNWKLVRLNEKIGAGAPPPGWKLYDLSRDIGEQNDVAAQHEDRAKELTALFETWRASMHPTVE